LCPVDIRTEPAVSFGKPSQLRIEVPIQTIGTPRNYDIAPDGKRFIVVMPATSAEAKRAGPQINVVLNWVEELKQRVPAQ